MTDYFILDENHQPIPATLQQWGVFMNKADRVVEQTYIGDIFISTVFLGIDHGTAWLDGRGPALTFETMIFRNDHGEDCWRYSTWDDAKIGHAAVVRRVKKEVGNA